eukprot:2417888-Lingulodinium_polyedra.AAC.1
MMRLKGRFVVTAVRKPRVRAFFAQTENWFARRVRKCAVYEPLWQGSVESPAPLRSDARRLQNGAVESTHRCRSSSQIARLRVPRAGRTV